MDRSVAPEPSFSLNASVESSPDELVSGLDQMSKELDDLVRFVRRGVEALAGGTSDGAPVFGVLSFALADWENWSLA